MGVDANPLATGLYRLELFDETDVVPPANSPDYWHSIQQLVKRHKIDIALVQPEAEVVEWARRRSETALPCQSLLPDLELARLLVDKALMSKALDETGLIPNSIDLDLQFAHLQAVEHMLPYPFWIRASAGSSGLGSLLVEDRESLKSWVRINKCVSSFLCSEYLPGRNLACKLLYYDGVLIRSACAERVNYIMAKVAPSGITGNTSFGRFLNEAEPVEISMRAMQKLFSEAGSAPHGLFTVDLKEDVSGNPKLTEVNVRNVAFNGCFAALGANFSSDMVRLLEGDESFDHEYRQYTFDEDYVFLRDVDVEPIVIRHSELKASFGDA